MKAIKRLINKIMMDCYEAKLFICECNAEELQLEGDEEMAVHYLELFNKYYAKYEKCLELEKELSK